MMDRWLKTGSVKRKANDDTDMQRKESGDASNESQSQHCLQQEVGPAPPKKTQHAGKSSAKVKRKYHDEYLKFGFFWTGDSEDPNPHCVLCYDILANEAMKPAKLKRHLETKHKDYISKPLAFFERKCEELKSHMQKDAAQYFVPGENAKATEASFRVSQLIAKAGKPYSIGETLVKPSAKIMANIMLGDNASNELDKIPLSNDTVQRRVLAMAENVQNQLISRLQQSSMFSLQLDESTDIGSEANLLCYGRYIYNGAVHDDFLFCHSLPTNTTGEAIFDSLNTFIGQSGLDWNRCVGICTDGATAMTAKHKGLVTRVRAVAPLATATHCCIHREQLAVKKMPHCLKTVLDEAVKIVNMIKGKSLNTRIFKVLCDEMGSEHTKLLFHTEVRWLSRGKVLTRLFELRDEVKLFMHQTDELYDRMHDFQWLATLSYLADIFSFLNSLNLALQGETVTIFTVQDKIKAARIKMDLWCTRLDRLEFDNFPTLADFLLTADEVLGNDTIAAFKEHLRGLHTHLGRYFPELDVDLEWIRNPFGDKPQIELVSSKLSARETDSLVDIASDGSLKMAFREKSLTDFWIYIQPEHPELAQSALKILMPFSTTYKCEVAFSALVSLKTKQRNQINVAPSMRLRLSSLEPDIQSVMQNMHQHHSSH